MGNSILFLLFHCAVLVTVTQPLKIETVQINRNRRTILAEDSTCSENQYFDKQEERCFTVIGGGKVIHINNTAFCGTNVLKPHRTDPNYYYICKWNKVILVQCPDEKQFANHLQKCVSTDEENLTPSFNAAAPLGQEIYDSEFIRLPPCEKSGSFRIPSDCTLFYTCETCEQQMVQKIYKCPKNMLYDAETEMCRFSSTCEEKSSNSFSRFCVSSVTIETIAQKHGTETKKANDPADKRNSISETYSTRFETSDRPNESSTVGNYSRNTFLNLNNNKSITNDGEFSSTTVSYTEPMPSDFTQSNDGYDNLTATDHFPEMSRLPNTVGSTSTTYPTINVEFTPVKETSLMKEETSKPLLRSIPLALLLPNKEYNSIITKKESLSTTERYEDTQTITEVEDSTFVLTTLSTDLLMSTDKSSDETTQTFSPTEITQSFSPSETTQSFSPTESAQSFSPPETTESFNPTETTESFSPPETTQSFNPTETTQSFSPPETTESFSPPETTQSFSPTETTQSFSPPETTESFNPTETTESFSPPETTQSFNPTETTQSFGPTENAQSFSPPETTESFSPPETTQSFNPTETTQSFSPPETTESFSPPETTQSFSPTETTQSFSPPETTESFNPTETTESFSPPETTQSFNPTETTQSFGPTESAQSFSPPETTESFSPTETTESFSPPETTQSFNATETTQSFGPTESAQSFSPPETTESFSPTETTESFSPPETTQSFNPTETTQSFSPTESAQSFSPPETTESFNPTETTESFSPPETTQSFNPTETTQSFSPTESAQSFNHTETSPISDETTINWFSSSTMNGRLLLQNNDITTEIYSEKNIGNSTQQTNELSSTTEMESTTMMSAVSSTVYSTESTENITEAFNNDKTSDELLKKDTGITVENSTNANNPKLIINTGDQELDSSITQTLSRCLNNTLLQTLAIIPSSGSTAKWNSSNNDANSKSFNVPPYSAVVDNELNVTSKQNECVAGKQSEAALNTTYSPRTISRKYVQPLMSAILNVTDRFERRIRNGLQQLARGNA